MTDEELAKHWNVSLAEVKSISDFMNKTYSLQVGKSKKDGLFYGLIYRMDKKHGPMLAISSKEGFKTPKAAAEFLNGVCDIMEMTQMRAELMNVPADAYKTLKKIDISIFTQKNKNPNTIIRPKERI